MKASCKEAAIVSPCLPCIPAWYLLCLERVARVMPDVVPIVWLIIDFCIRKETFS